MRLVSFNLLHGRSLTDGRVDGDRLGAAVAALAADVLAIQEVDRDQPRSGGLDLTAIAAAAMGAPAAQWRFAPAVFGTPGHAWQPARDRSVAVDDPRPYGSRTYGSRTDDPRTDDPRTDDGDPRPAPLAGPLPGYGIGLVSRWPVRSWLRVELPRAPLRSPVPVPGRRVPLMLLDDEPRVGLAAVVDAPTGPMTVVSTHLSFVPGWNAVQLGKLVRDLRGLPDPLVLLGDLNLPGRVPGWLTRWRALAPGVPTYPAPDPRVQLDHALVRGPLAGTVTAHAEQLPLSDHRALVIDVS